MAHLTRRFGWVHEFLWQYFKFGVALGERCFWEAKQGMLLDRSVYSVHNISTAFGVFILQIVSHCKLWAGYIIEVNNEIFAINLFKTHEEFSFSVVQIEGYGVEAKRSGPALALRCVCTYSKRTGNRNSITE